MDIDDSDPRDPFLRQGSIIFTKSGHSFRTHVYSVRVYPHNETDFVEDRNGLSPRPVRAAFSTGYFLEMTSLEPPFPVKIDNHNVPEEHKTYSNVIRGPIDNRTKKMRLYLPGDSFPRKWEPGQVVSVHLPTERANPGREVPDISELIDELT